MSIFESELKKGEFIFPECLTCMQVVWPPSDYCNLCLEKVHWKKLDRIGKILEYSKKGDVFFCLAEFEKKIRIMGKLQVYSKQPEIGQKVKLEKFGVDGTNYHFIMSLI